jgi:hypothetical protein
MAPWGRWAVRQNFRPQAGSYKPASAIHILPVPDFQYDNQQSAILDTVNDPINAGTNAVDVIVALQSARTAGPGITCQVSDHTDNTKLNCFLKFTKLFLSAGRELNPIVTHQVWRKSLVVS